MTEKKQRKLSDRDVYIEMLSGAATALTYTDKEIRDTFLPEDAQEFIDLRDKIFAELDIDKRKYGLASDEDSSDDLPLAAEEEATYEKWHNHPSIQSAPYYFTHAQNYFWAISVYRHKAVPNLSASPQTAISPNRN